MNRFKVFWSVIFLMYVSTSFACRYTIREIGFSTLSKVTYIVYRVDENTALFPKQLSLSFSESNVKTFGLNIKDNASNPVVNFVKQQKLSLPVYIMADPNGQMLPISVDQFNGLKEAILFSPVQKQLESELPSIYATVLLVEGENAVANELARKRISNSCQRIDNIMPNMPKQVENGPNMVIISKDNFEQEKVVLWSLGIKKIPQQPIAFVVYGRGRIIGEKISFEEIKGEKVYKLLSIIGADCECGLDRKWMLGYQIPLNWQKNTQQILSDKLGFDVDNPMILTEMSRILAIENKIAKDPDGVSFEPIVIDLDKEFNDVPEINHFDVKKPKESVFQINKIIIYSILILICLVIIGAFLVMRKKT